MPHKNVATLFVDTLVAAGVDKIYGLAGDSLNGITDAIRTRMTSDGFPCGMKRRPRLPPERMRILRGTSPSARGVAGRGICT